MAFRGCIPDFQLANPLYIGATVSFFTVNPDGTATASLATLYSDPTSTNTALNPQTLDSEGKFVAPVYIETPVIAQVEGANVESHTTGVINARGTWRGAWVTNTNYFSTDFVQDPVSGNIYLAALDYTSGVSLQADVTAGSLVLEIDQTAIVSGGASLAIKAAVQCMTGSADGNLSLSGLPVIDGYQTKAGDRVGVNYQTNQAQNGIYTAATGAWVRTSDAFQSSMFSNGCIVSVINGNINLGKLYELSIGSPFTLGTSPLNWVALVNPSSSIPVQFTSAPDAFLQAGVIGYVNVPFAATISEVILMANADGSVVIDIWKCPFTAFPPTIANSIVAADKPTLINAQSMSDSALTGWTTQLNEGDVLAFTIDSVSGLKSVMCQLMLSRS